MKVGVVAALRVVLHEGDDVEPATLDVDHGRTGDTDLGNQDLLVQADQVQTRSRSTSATAEDRLCWRRRRRPSRARWRRTGRRACRPEGRIQVGDVERLRIDEPVDREREQVAEVRTDDVRRELDLGEVGAGSGVVVVMRQNADSLSVGARNRDRVARRGAAELPEYKRTPARRRQASQGLTYELFARTSPSLPCSFTEPGRKEGLGATRAENIRPDTDRGRDGIGIPDIDR